MKKTESDLPGPNFTTVSVNSNNNNGYLTNVISFFERTAVSAASLAYGNKANLESNDDYSKPTVRRATLEKSQENKTSYTKTKPPPVPVKPARTPPLVFRKSVEIPIIIPVSTISEPRFVNGLTIGECKQGNGRRTMSCSSDTRDASEVLAAALEQMDGIIAGTKMEIPSPVPDNVFASPRSSGGARSLAELLEELKDVMSQGPDKNDNLRLTANSIPDDTRFFLIDWLQNRSTPAATNNLLDYEEVQDKMHRLESDKENLTLQVSVLNEQIDAQSDKIRDLEALLQEKKQQLANVENMLQHELVTRSSLETQKLDLMSEISSLKLKLATAERDKLDLGDRSRRAEMESASLKLSLAEKENEVASMKAKLARGLLTPSDTAADIEKLKRCLETARNSNDEKDRKIEDLHKAITRYRKLQELILNTQGRKDGFLLEEDNLDMYLPNVSTPVYGDNKIEDRGSSRPPASSRLGPATAGFIPIANDGLQNSGSASSSTPRRSQSSQMGSSGTREKSPPISKTPPPTRSKHAVQPFGSLPRQRLGGSQTSSPAGDQRSLTNNPELDNFRPSKKSSGITFVNAEPTIIEDQPPITPEGPRETSPEGKKPKGIFKVFGRLRRSNSQSLDRETGYGDFRRGGVRATTGPRLYPELVKGDKNGIDVPFARWDTDRVATWFHHMGLGAYMADCKRWVKNGDHLLKATAFDLEKELGIRHPLHRKKLQLALQAAGSESEDLAGALDYQWVTRWLDDVGLPQYKDAFEEARIDGRVLHYLTIEDLFSMKVSNLLHITSLKRGIQALRQHNFNPSCLKRRPAPEEQDGQPDDVALWTNHRVMEWLRCVDLSEYAPNLRGSGVHGALLVYEARFNSEVLATLLSISSTKTLLRRHLNTHFKQLVGAECIQQKRELEASQGYVQMTPNIKIKAVKHAQFSLVKKKGKQYEMDMEEYVCPMDVPGKIGARINNHSPYENLVDSADRERDQRAAEEIGAVSKEISSLTTLLKDEQLLANMNSSNV